MARNIRVIPLNKPGVIPATTANGRNFSPLSAYLDVADGDAAILGASGWTTVGLVGTTANRPAQSDADMSAQFGPGLKYIDTTIGAVIQWDGAAWRNVLTGAAV